MYDELKEKCRACSQGCNYPAECSYFNKPPLRCMMQLLSEAADAIEKLCKLCVKWESVEKRLPDAHKEVYVTDGEYIERANLLDEVFPGDQPCWSYSGLGEITHWCEQIQLPPPAEEGE